MLNSLKLFVPLIVAVGATGIVLRTAHWGLISRHGKLGNERLFPRQLLMLGLTFLSLLVCVLVLPIDNSSRNQLIGLVGIVLSGVFALSSKSVIANLMAGLLLRITKPFNLGDFIRIGDHFGRVSERGLFDTELQTENRELIALPNTYCINNPVTTIRSSGTIISVMLSLGYDLDHKRMEHLLVEAAQSCGLEDPFAHIVELGDFAVTYRISGFLEDSKHLISMRSNLAASVLDKLHCHGVEIMSPSYMNQRPLKDNTRVIPDTTVFTAPLENIKTSAEDIAFDKAEQAEKLENQKLQLVQEIERQEAALKEDKEKEQKKEKKEAVEQLRQRLKELEDSADSAATDQ